LATNVAGEVRSRSGARNLTSRKRQTGLALVGAGGAIIAVIAVTAGSSGGNGAVQPNAQVAPATTS